MYSICWCQKSQEGKLKAENDVDRGARGSVFGSEVRQVYYNATIEKQPRLTVNQLLE